MNSTIAAAVCSSTAGNKRKLVHPKVVLVLINDYWYDIKKWIDKTIWQGNMAWHDMTWHDMMWIDLKRYSTRSIDSISLTKTHTQYQHTNPSLLTHIHSRNGTGGQNMRPISQRRLFPSLRASPHPRQTPTPRHHPCLRLPLQPHSPQRGCALQQCCQCVGRCRRERESKTTETRSNRHEQQQ